MTAPVHYDVEASVAAFRKSAALLVVPEGAPLSAHIHGRHTEVNALMLRMTLEELNAGANLVDIVDAAASIVVSHLDNMGRPFPTEIRAQLQHRFLERMCQALNALADGKDGGDFTTSESAPVHATIGGHA